LPARPRRPESRVKVSRYCRVRLRLCPWFVIRRAWTWWCAAIRHPTVADRPCRDTSSSLLSQVAAEGRRCFARPSMDATCHRLVGVSSSDVSCSRLVVVACWALRGSRRRTQGLPGNRLDRRGRILTFKVVFGLVRLAAAAFDPKGRRVAHVRRTPNSSVSPLLAACWIRM
jgi:hypothetical protein